MKKLIKFNIGYFLLRFAYNLFLVKIVQWVILKFGAKDAMIGTIGARFGMLFGSSGLKWLIIMDIACIIFLLLRKIGNKMKKKKEEKKLMQRAEKAAINAAISQAQVQSQIQMNSAPSSMPTASMASDLGNMNSF